MFEPKKFFTGQSEEGQPEKIWVWINSHLENHSITFY